MGGKIRRGEGLDVHPSGISSKFVSENYVPLKETGRPKGYGIQRSLAYIFSGS